MDSADRLRPFDYFEHKVAGSRRCGRKGVRTPVFTRWQISDISLALCGREGIEWPFSDWRTQGGRGQPER
jgi:hypothetical protein